MREWPAGMREHICGWPCGDDQKVRMESSHARSARGVGRIVGALPALACGAGLVMGQAVGAPHFADGKQIVADIEALLAIDQHKIFARIGRALLAARRGRRATLLIAGLRRSGVTHHLLPDRESDLIAD